MVKSFELLNFIWHLKWIPSYRAQEIFALGFVAQAHRKNDVQGLSDQIDNSYSLRSNRPLQILHYTEISAQDFLILFSNNEK